MCDFYCHDPAVQVGIPSLQFSNVGHTSLTVLHKFAKKESKGAEADLQRTNTLDISPNMIALDVQNIVGS